MYHVLLDVIRKFNELEAVFSAITESLSDSVLICLGTHRRPFKWVYDRFIASRGILAERVCRSIHFRGNLSTVCMTETYITDLNFIVRQGDEKQLPSLYFHKCTTIFDKRWEILHTRVTSLRKFTQSSYRMRFETWQESPHLLSNFSARHIVFFVLFYESVNKYIIYWAKCNILSIYYVTGDAIAAMNLEPCLNFIRSPGYFCKIYM